MKKSAHSLPFIQPHLVGDHRNELRVRWFSPQVMDGVAEVAVEGLSLIHIYFVRLCIILYLYAQQTGTPGFAHTPPAVLGRQKGEAELWTLL